MTKLSVNINKFATLRNSRGGNNPDVIEAALNAEKFGAEGITVHPRPDERHIRYSDVRQLAHVVKTEFNIEGNPREKKFVDLVIEVKPTQVTLVPDDVSALTSNQGWDTIKHKDFLTEMVTVFKNAGIRTSLFIDPIPEMIQGAALTGTDRVELYTEAYAEGFYQNPEVAIAPYKMAAQKAHELGIGLNAGHDLNLDNLRYFQQHIIGLLEVSIGHAIVCDALYLGFETTIQKYLKELKNF